MEWGIMTAIVLTTDNNAVERIEDMSKTISRIQTANRLAREGLAEVHFLMNALESNISKFSTFIEEIHMQGIDILLPSAVAVDLQTEGVTDEIPITFPAFLEFQRIFREAFVNIVKHSDATGCMVRLHIRKSTIEIALCDNGSIVTTGFSDTGHGLHSMKRRVEKMGGNFSCWYADGFHIGIVVPKQAVTLSGAEEKVIGSKSSVWTIDANRSG